MNLSNINLSKKLKYLSSDENKTKLIGLLTILVLLWLILYFIPEIVTLLFNTILGNLILVIMTLIIMMYNLQYGIIISIILIIIYRFSRMSREKEGFAWNNNSIQDFLLIQTTINRNKIFDVNMMQETGQATQQELDYFNKHGKWPWSKKTTKLYEDAINKNPYIRTYSGDAVNYARTIYNEAAIQRILSYQTKEGQFLLNGITIKGPTEQPGFGVNSGLIENTGGDIIKCNMNNSTLERITYTGRGPYGEKITKTTPVDYTKLENVIPNFTFVNEPCNPCIAVNKNPEYSCPFNIKVKNEPPFISDVWHYLWNMDDKTSPSFLSKSINPNEFPILSELEIALNKPNK